jgi:hypothetical protein
MGIIRNIWQMITDGAKPFNWLSLAVEVVTVIMVAFVFFLLDVPEWRRKRRIAKRVALLEPILQSGRELQSSFPPFRDLPAEIHDRWVERAEAWSFSTRETLDAMNPMAAAFFAFIANASKVDRVARHSDGSTSYPVSRTGDAYQFLQIRIDNLQHIMERPEAYL